MRAWAVHVLNRSSSLGSPGGTELSWPAPVYGGDMLAARSEVLAARVSRSRPTLGLVDVRATLHRDEVCVFRAQFVALFGTRPTRRR
jgi:acyl dehydratase